MRKYILILLILGQAPISFAQNPEDETGLKTLLKADIGLQGIGVTFEPRLGKKMTMDLSAGAGGGYSVWEGGIEYEINIFQPAFYFSITPKFFYNRQKRMKAGKVSQSNAGNYIGLRLKYATPSVAPNDALRETFLVNLHWGLQRALGKHWTLNAHAGAGYAQDIPSSFGTLYPALDVKFSYNLFVSKR
ncbi:MAG: hypothetical protein ABIN67_12650 [Ferruginibacter sp.]